MRATAKFTPSPDAAALVAALKAGARSGAEAAGNYVLAEAQGRAPVRTGNLRDGIVMEMIEADGMVIAEISATVDYSAHVEFGTRHAPAEPFLRPALDHGRERAISAVGEGVGGAIK